MCESKSERAAEVEVRGLTVDKRGVVDAEAMRENSAVDWDAETGLVFPAVSDLDLEADGRVSATARAALEAGGFGVFGV